MENSPKSVAFDILTHCPITIHFSLYTCLQNNPGEHVCSNLLPLSRISQSPLSKQLSR